MILLPQHRGLQRSPIRSPGRITLFNSIQVQNLSAASLTGAAAKRPSKNSLQLQAQNKSYFEISAC